MGRTHIWIHALVLMLACGTLRAQSLNYALERALAQANERLKGLNEQQEQLSAKINDLQSQQQQLEKDRPAFQQFLKNKEKLQVLETEKSRQINQKTVAARLVETRQHLAEIQEKRPTSTNNWLKKRALSKTCV